MNAVSQYMRLYQKKLIKRVILEFIFGAVVMYLGCRIYPGSLSPAQGIYFPTAVVFALYTIRGYRITAGLLIGGTLAYYFSVETQFFSFLPAKWLNSIAHTLEILFCAFLIRYLLDKWHMALLSMRNLKEISAFIVLAILIPQLVFNFLVTPITSVAFAETALGHSVGILSLAPIFLVWHAHVPNFSPPALPVWVMMCIFIYWLAVGSLTYLFCYAIDVHQYIWAVGYLALLLLLIALSSKAINRFYHVIGMGFMGLSFLAYMLFHPLPPQSLVLSHFAYMQMGIIFVCAVWLGVLCKLR